MSQTGQSGKEKRILPSKIPKKTKSKKNKSGLRKRRKGLLESTVPPSTLRWRLFSSAGGLSRDLISGRRIPSRNKQSKRKQEPTSPVAAGSCPSCLPDKSQAKISGGSVVARAALAAEFHAFFQQCPAIGTGTATGGLGSSLLFGSQLFGLGTFGFGFGPGPLGFGFGLVAFSLGFDLGYFVLQIENGLVAIGDRRQILIQNLR